MGKHTQVVEAARTSADLQLVDDAVAQALSAPLFTDNQRPNLGERRAERHKFSAGDDQSASIDRDDEAIDPRRQFAQLAGQKMTRLLIPLNQLVNLPCIAADSRPKLRRPVPGDAADLTASAEATAVRRSFTRRRKSALRPLTPST